LGVETGAGEEVRARRASSAAWAWLYTRLSRAGKPPEPRIAAEWSAAAYHPAQKSPECPAKTSTLIGFVRVLLAYGDPSASPSGQRPAAASHVKNDIGKDHNAVAPRKIKADGTCGKDNGCKVHWTAIYSFAPPGHGNMVPNSSHWQPEMKSLVKSCPQNESKRPATQSNRDAPTEDGRWGGSNYVCGRNGVSTTASVIR
jgi:hypothetical protein